MDHRAPTIDDLHDAILLSVHLDWRSRSARLALKLAHPWSGRFDLVATAFANVVCPRCDPWGPSVFVNGVSGPAAGDDGRLRLDIEMQSGDVIVLEAERFTLVPVDD